VRTGDAIRIGHAWYLYDGGPERFRETVDRSEAWLSECIRRAESVRGWVPPSRVLLGYSQGAYFAYVAALRHPELFSHLVAVAGRLKAEFLPAELARGGSLETLIVHGRHDAAVHPDAALGSRDALRHAGFRAEHLELPGGHAFTPETDAACADWISSRILDG
jgi:predicted esterase